MTDPAPRLSSYPTPTAPPTDAGWLAPENRAILGSTVPSAAWILEVGSFCGLSARHLLDAHPGASIVCVDPWPASFLPFPAGFDPFDSFAASCWEYRDRIIPMRGTSAAVLPDLLARGFRPDLVYIDGDHEFGPALEDIRNALRFPDAVILGDDFAPDWPGVRAAVLQAAWESREMLRVVGRCWRMR